MSELSVLSSAKCEELLRAAIVGRVAYNTDEGPQIVPVNYTTVDQAIVFRTGPDTQLGRHAVGRPLAFEIDQVDYDDHKGWSVVAGGIGELVEDTASLEEANAVLEPQAVGGRGPGALRPAGLDPAHRPPHRFRAGPATTSCRSEGAEDAQNPPSSSPWRRTRSA